MSNMSYCRFQNTLRDLRDCQTSLQDADKLNKEEVNAREGLLLLCKELAEEYLDEDGRFKEVQIPFDRWVAEVDGICCELHALEVQGGELDQRIISYASARRRQVQGYGDKLSPKEFMQRATEQGPLLYAGVTPKVL